jgi:hypothetical protein
MFTCLLDVFEVLHNCSVYWCHFVIHIFVTPQPRKHSVSDKHTEHRYIAIFKVTVYKQLKKYMMQYD